MAAPSFFLSLLLVWPAAAQRPRLEVRAAVLASSTLVEDVLATPALKARLGPGLGESLRARAAAGPELSAGAMVPLRPGVSLSGLVGWQQATLRAEDAGGTRDLQELALVHALLSAEFALRGALVAGAGVGMLGYRSDPVGLFTDGVDLSPLVRVSGGGRWVVRGHAISVRALADVHRFGSPLLRIAGGSGGAVLRYGVQVGVVPGGGR